METDIEFAWLVEEVGEGMAPRYLVGFLVFPTRFPDFGFEHERAIRFSRQVDAQKMIDQLGLWKCKPIQHSWG